jgi:hypothetical protein
MTPQELARRFDRCIDLAADWPWRPPEVCAFADWLAGFWEMACPVMPAGAPAATSISASNPACIHWFATDEAILGYVVDHTRGCYRIPRGAEPPDGALAGETGRDEVDDGAEIRRKEGGIGEE